MKAISLFSGGLDSMLAAAVVRGLGIDVIPVHFAIPFGCTHQRFFKDAESADIGEDFLEVLKSPEHGFGSNMNPCIDCKILMLRKAKEMMASRGASFLVTGEVAGQRPMSQSKSMLRHIEKMAGVEDLVLRPLSAKLLPETLPEKKGWVDRARLLGIGGRGRLEQMRLAGQYGITDIPQPAGGCLLTDPAFSRRIKDLKDHDALTMSNATLLHHGRFFRLTEKTMLFVGKNQRENERLESLAMTEDYVFFPANDGAGATGLGRGDFASQELLRLAAQVTGHYFDAGKTGESVTVSVRHRGQTQTITVDPFSIEETKKYLI